MLFLIGLGGNSRGCWALSFFTFILTIVSPLFKPTECDIVYNRPIGFLLAYQEKRGAKVNRGLIYGDPNLLMVGEFALGRNRCQLVHRGGNKPGSDRLPLTH